VLDSEILNKVTILRKPNVGYDFGSWSVGLLTFPEICQAKEVLLLNDSNSGPFGALGELLNKMNESPYDITGITDSLQHRYHIQSYMMHFKNNSLKNKAMVAFWQNIRSQSKKFDVVLAYELGLTSRAQGNGLYVGAVYPWNILIDYWENASVKAWERLLDLGYPFIKREVVRSFTPKQISSLVDNRFGNSSEHDLIKAMITQDANAKQN
jgi:lipopolysaccharide biosynthesis protein